MGISSVHPVVTLGLKGVALDGSECQCHLEVEWVGSFLGVYCYIRAMAHFSCQFGTAGERDPQVRN